MSKKKKSVLPGIEVLIILVFFINVNNPTAANNDPLATADTIIVATPAATPPAVATTPVPTLPQGGRNSAANATTYATRLYVTIDGLNVRTGPSLDSTAISKLALYEEVYFLNEITPFTQQISLGAEMANEPWVKIKSRSGLEGWVYGAGVYYYKRKRDGVEE